MPTRQDDNAATDNEFSVGARLRQLRRSAISRKRSGRLSGMSLNAVSLLERDVSSPNVATLQRLATALNVRISVFFETDQQATVIYVQAGQRPALTSRGVTIEGIGLHLEGQQMQPFLLTLAPHSDIGNRLVTHTGHEFVCCLKGTVKYEVDETTYLLRPGDMLLFEAALPHSCPKSRRCGSPAGARVAYPRPAPGLRSLALHRPSGGRPHGLADRAMIAATRAAGSLRNSVPADGQGCAADRHPHCPRRRPEGRARVRQVVAPAFPRLQTPVTPLATTLSLLPS